MEKDKKVTETSAATSKAKSPFAVIGAFIGILVICGVCALIGYFMYKGLQEIELATDGPNSIADTQLEDDSAVLVYGKVVGFDPSMNSFTLTDGAESVEVYYKETEGLDEVDMSEIESGQWVVVHGTYSRGLPGIKAKKVTISTPEEIEEYRNEALPELTFYVNDYPSSVPHSCRPFEVDVTVVNSGKVAVSHPDIYDSLSSRRFFYVVNDGRYKMDNYYVLAEDGDDNFKLGLGDFGILRPGEEKDVKFYGGGFVTANVDTNGDVVGYSGESNIFSPSVQTDGQEGSNTLLLVWGATTDVDGNYIGDNPEIVTSSEKMLINLESAECDNLDVNGEERVQ